MTTTDDRPVVTFSCPEWCQGPDGHNGKPDVRTVDGRLVVCHDGHLYPAVPAGTGTQGVEFSWGGEETQGLGWTITVHVEADDVILTAAECRQLATYLTNAADEIEAVQR